MMHLIGHELKANARGLLFWCIGMAALCGIGFYEFKGMQDAGAMVASVADVMPKIAQVMFGMADAPLSSPEGYYSCMYLFICLIAFLHAALLGSGILAKEERDKTADFLFTRPIPRSRIITAKFVVGFIQVVVLNAVAWITTVLVFLPQTGSTDLSQSVTFTMIGMLIIQVLFLCVGMACAGLAKNDRQAAGFAAGAVLLSYFLMIFLKMLDLGYLYVLSPFLYFDAYQIIENGMNYWYVALAGALIVIALGAAYRLYMKRDLRN